MLKSDSKSTEKTTGNQAAKGKDTVDCNIYKAYGRNKKHTNKKISENA